MANPTLLSLPAEIRHQILIEAVSIRYPLSISPSATEPRVPLPNVGVGEYVYIKNGDGNNRTTQTSLLLTNRQLQADTQHVLEFLSREMYELDVMFVNRWGLLPTWTYIPGFRRNIGAIRVSLRLFNRPDQEWQDRATYQGGMNINRGIRPAFMSILALLSQYLLRSCSGARWDASRPQHVHHDDKDHFAGSRIRSIVLAIPEPPPKPPSETGSTQDQETWWSGIRLGSRRRCGLEADRETKLAYISQIALRSVRSWEPYARYLLANVGKAEVWLGEECLEEIELGGDLRQQ